jgi:PAS domain-containing protein
MPSETPILPLQLSHSWPLYERARHFDLGYLHDDASPRETLDEQELDPHGIGIWSCELADNALTWSGSVYDLFGLPRGARISRPETVALYSEHSRALMERLRAYAIKHRRGFTLDAEILPAGGGRRWMRLVAAPIDDGARVVRLYGLKRDVSHEYR